MEAAGRVFQELFAAGLDAGKVVCVGLDSDAGKLPILHLGLNYSEGPLVAAQEAYRQAEKAKPGSPEACLNSHTRWILARAQLAFNKAIIDVTKHIVLAYKPNSGFYEALGDHGVAALSQTVEYIKQVVPNVVVILDAKRGDIDSTNNGYVAYAFNYVGADAVTVSPYLGKEAMEPFLNCQGKGIIVLCRTSNKGADEFQDLMLEPVDGYPAEPLYQRVARRVTGEWNDNSGNCLLVIGATYPEEAGDVRQISDLAFLIPGLGKQQGDLEGTVTNCRDSDGVLRAFVNNSRAVIFASDGADFAEAAARAAQKMHDDIMAVPQAA